jgi:hypothetical protein
MIKLKEYQSYLVKKISLSRAFWLYGNIILAILIVILVAAGLLFIDNFRDLIILQKFSSELFYKKLILKILAIFIILYTIFITYIIWQAANRYQGARKYFYGAKIISVLTALLTIKDIIKYFF